MKTLISVITLLVSMAVCVSAQTAFSVPRVVDRGAQHKVWQWEIYTNAPGGQLVTIVHKFTELATGLNHLVNGKWADSQEKIVILPNGTAAATNGQHQAYFPANIYTGAIRMVKPDGQVMQSRPVAMSYDDGSNTVMLAVLTNAVGYLVGTNQVIYPNAFTGIKADLRYRYTKSGLEQDVILRQQPPTPESLGINPDTAQLQVLTEFFSPPSPTIQSSVSKARPRLSLTDQNLDFGTMKMVKGRAFLIGTNSTWARVNKQWVLLGGRRFLVEQVLVDDIGDKLATLPLTAINSGSSKASKTASRHLTLPPERLVQNESKSSILLAMNESPMPGLVLDYQALNSTISTNFTFQSDTTYYISGNLNLYGASTFEGGTVIKYAPNTTINLETSANYFLGSSYRPIIFTAVDDNSVGEAIGTNTISGYYASCALTFNNSAPFTLSNFRISYASSGVIWWSGGSAISVAANGQFFNCGNGFVSVIGVINVQNVLFDNVASDLVGYYTAFSAQNCTFANNSYVMAVIVPGVGSSYAITNSTFCNVSVISPPSGTTAAADHNAFYNSGGGTTIGTSAYLLYTYPYQTVGGGGFYLINGSGCQNNGTVNIDPYLLASLAWKTTYVPLLYSNVTLSANLFFYPQAHRDATGNPDLGYHYDPLDYVFDNCYAQSNLTFNAGTAVAWLGTNSGFGILLGSNVTAAFNGNATAPDYFVRLNTVQENDQSGISGFSLGGLVGSGTSTSPRPQIRANFLTCSMMGGENGAHFTDYGCNMLASAVNSEFWSGGVSMSGSSSSLNLTNCLFNRTKVAFLNGSNSIISLQNCTMRGGSLGGILNLGRSPVVWSSAFDGTSFGTATNGICDYNAYLQGTEPLAMVGTHDVTVTNSFNWQSSWFGNFYQPPNSPLINKGNTNANLLGLYHFTTQTNQAPETNSMVDIGYHYVATDGFGNPLDSNGDSIPNYQQDPLGNGLPYGGTNWAIAILTQPVGQTVYQGNNASFSVTAGGLATLAYQWQATNSSTGGFTNMVNGGQRIAGANSSVLGLTAVTTNQALAYRVIVSNGYGSVTSSPANLTVSTVISTLVNVQFDGSYNFANSTATAGPVQTGAAVLGLAGDRWNVQTHGYYDFASTVFSGVPLTNSDGTSLGLNLAVTQPGNPVYTGTYPGSGYGAMDVGSSNLMSSALETFNYSTYPGYINFSISGLTPYTNTAFTLVVYAGSHVAQTETITVTGGSTGGNTGSALTTSSTSRQISSGAGVAYNTFTGILTNGTLSFRVSGGAAQYSTLAVNGFQLLFGRIPDPAIYTAPASQTVNWGNNASFNVTAMGTSPFHYQWQANGGTGFTNLMEGGQISGSQSNILNIMSVTPFWISPNWGLTYRVIVTNSVGSVTSAPAILTVSYPGVYVPPGGDVNGAIYGQYIGGGGVVNLGPGTYYGGVNMYPNVTLNGAGSNTVIAGATVTQGWYGDNITVQNLVVDGRISCSAFSIGYSGPAGLFFGNDNFDTHNLTFNNVEVKNTSIALQAINVAGVFLNNCNFHDNGIGYSHSIYFTGDYNVVMNNCVSSWGRAGFGVHLDFSQNIGVPNSFNQCEFTGAAGYGVFNQGYANNANANDIHFYGCKLQFNGQSGGAGDGINTDGGGYLEASRLEYNNGYGAYISDDVGLFYDLFNGNAANYYWSYGPIAYNVYGGSPANQYDAVLADGVTGPNNTADWVTGLGGSGSATEGVVSFANHSANGSLTWSAVSSTGGSHTMTFHYSNGTSTNLTMGMIVNGGATNTLTFPSTGGWSTYGTINTSATLTAQNNSVKMQVAYPGATSPVLSSLVVTDAVPSAPAAPTGLAYQALTNAPQYDLSEWIQLSWNAVSGATYYDILRNGLWIAVGVTTNNFIDKHVWNSATSYTYTVVAVNAGGYNSSQITAVSLTGFPISLSANVNGPGSVTLNCANSLNATSYNVYRSTNAAGPFTAIATGVGTSYTDNLAPGGTDYYYMTAYNGLTESLPSPLAAVNVSPLVLAITNQPVSQTTNAGVTVSFHVGVVGYPVLAYRWFFNATNLLTGATSPTLTLTNVQLSQAGNYRVTVTNLTGSVTSSNAALTVMSWTADSDYDGVSDAQEVLDGTDPINPDSVWQVRLGYWPFDNTNTWAGSAGQLPLLATNVVGVPSWTTNAVLIDSTNAAILAYRDVETNGNPNINLRRGSVRLWFRADWNSGTGSGCNGRLIEMGSQTATNGWWALIFNTNGTQLTFGSQTNGLALTNLTASIYWASNQWHQVVLTYTATNSLLYLDGQLATNGIGSINYPNATERAKGLRICSDVNGYNQAGGVMDELETFNYPLAAGDILSNYQAAIALDNDADGISNILENQLGLNPYGYNSVFGLNSGNALQVFTPLK